MPSFKNPICLREQRKEKEKEKQFYAQSTSHMLTDQVSVQGGQARAVFNSNFLQD